MMVNKKITITIVTLSYNYSAYLDQTIQSVLNQDQLPDEYIIIDDASTDGSVEIIKKYESAKFIKTIYHKKNQGIINTLNEALRLAKGDFILFLAADDFLHPSIIKEYKEYIDRYPDIGFCCSLTNRLILATNETILNVPQADFPEGHVGPKEAKKLINRYGPWFCGNTALLSRRKTLENGGFDPKLLSYTDGFLYMTLALKYGLVFINKPLATYREHMQSYSLQTAASSQKVNQIKTEILKIMGSDPLVFDKEFIRRWRGRWEYMQFNFRYVKQLQKLPFFGKFLVSMVGFVFYRWFDVLNIRFLDVKAFYKKYRGV